MIVVERRLTRLVKRASDFCPAQKQEERLAPNRGSRRHSQAASNIAGKRINQSVATIPIKSRAVTVQFRQLQADPCFVLGEQGEPSRERARKARAARRPADCLQS